MEKRELGNWGEEQAAKYLRRRGYRILDRNFSCRFGEIDIIASKGNYVAFVEVKLRKDDSFARAMEFVGRGKQCRIITSAQLWLGCHECELQPRFDVVEVYAPKGVNSLRIKINHIENAFQ